MLQRHALGEVGLLDQTDYASNTGVLPMRSLFLEFPDDPVSWQIDFSACARRCEHLFLSADEPSVRSCGSGCEDRS
jgi:hypothetical protein